jgi:DNA-binding PadR family transcriptional regulator
MVLLALVRLGPDAYGATVRREIEHRARREVSISAVYTTLERLEQKGLVRSRVGAPTAERGGRRRRHFEMLPLGARSLRDAYDALSGMTAGIEHRLKTLS